VSVTFFTVNPFPNSVDAAMPNIKNHHMYICMYDTWL
jgi:hypothetical protein